MDEQRPVDQNPINTVAPAPVQQIPQPASVTPMAAATVAVFKAPLKSKYLSPMYVIVSGVVLVAVFGGGAYAYVSSVHHKAPLVTQKVASTTQATNSSKSTSSTSSASTKSTTTSPTTAKTTTTPAKSSTSTSTSSTATGSGSGGSSSSGGSSFAATVSAFLTALQTNDKTTADSLESPAFQAYVQQNLGTTSFYSACQSEGAICTDAFTTTYLATGTLATSSYTATSGTVGQQDVWTIASSNSSDGNSSSSSTTVTIAAVPSGNTWLIDNVDEEGNVNVN